MADKKITRQLSIFINGKEIKNSLGAIGREIGKVKGKLKEANDPADIKKYKAELEQLRGKYADVKEEIHDSNAVLEDARGHWDNLLSGFLSGNPRLAADGIKGIKNNLKGATKAALAFIATPLGAAIAVLVGIGAGAKAWLEFNLEIEKSNQLIRDLTQESGLAVDAIRIRAEVLQETFEVDITKSVETAKSMVKSFGISYDDAFDIIEDGAVRGKLKNDEYLDSLREYPIQFKNAGFSAKEFADIVETGIDLSIYNDKLPDAIKEFTLSITEETDAAKEAMVNAFGKEFTTKLFNDLKNGAKTPKEALKSIALEAERIGLNSQQAQLLTADLFKGAGEDAGGALKIFEAVNISLNEQKKPLTELQEVQKQQLDTNKELAGVYKRLFASSSSGLGLMIKKGKLFATQVLLDILKRGVDLYNWFVDLNNESGLFSAILKSISVSAKTAFKTIAILVEGAFGSFKGLGNVVAGVFTLDWERVQKGFAQGVGNLSNIISNLKEQAVNDAEEIKNALRGNNKLEKISFEDIVADDTQDVSDVDFTPDNGNVEGDELTKEDQRILDSKKKLAEFIKQWEEDQRIQKELEGLEGDERAQEEELLKLEAKLLKMEEEAGLIGEKEIELSEADQELKTQLEELKQKSVEDIRNKYQKKADKDRLENFKKEYGDVEAHHKRLADSQIKLEQAKKNALLFGIDTLKSVFGEKTGIYKALFILEKGLAIAEIVTGTAKSNAKITTSLAAANAAAVAASPLTLGQPFVGINTATAIAQKTAATINAGVQIASIAGSAIKGFKKGGPTGNNVQFKDDNGDGVTGVVHENEWVAPEFMTSDPRFANTLQWLEMERKKILGNGFVNGGNTSTVESQNGLDTPAEQTEESSENLLLLSAIERLNNNLEKGIKSYTVRDMEDFERQREDDEEFEEIIENTRFE